MPKCNAIHLTSYSTTRGWGKDYIVPDVVVNFRRCRDRAVYVHGSTVARAKLENSSRFSYIGFYSGLRGTVVTPMLTRVTSRSFDN
jgi:hypothetical protein